jgi:nucleotide-binding universal stress UspA family protein
VFRVINVQNILYATDFSSYSNQAYFHAVALAENWGASLTVVHIFTAGGAAAPAGEADERGYWRGQLEQIRPLNPRIPVEHVLLDGNPADEIIRYATDSRTNLIVLGTHGRTGLERLLMGSVAEKVLRGAPCSVLVVKMPKAAFMTEPVEAPVRG